MNNEEIAVQLANHENRLSVSEHRIKDLEEFQKNQNELIRSVDKLAVNMESMLSEQKVQGERLKALEGEPAKRWSDARKAFFNALLGAVGTAVAAGVMWLMYFVITRGGI